MMVVILQEKLLLLLLLCIESINFTYMPQVSRHIYVVGIQQMNAFQLTSFEIAINSTGCYNTSHNISKNIDLHSGNKIRMYNDRKQHTKNTKLNALQFNSRAIRNSKHSDCVNNQLEWVLICLLSSPFIYLYDTIICGYALNASIRNQTDAQ